MSFWKIAERPHARLIRKAQEAEKETNPVLKKQMEDDVNEGYHELEEDNMTYKLKILRGKIRSKMTHSEEVNLYFDQEGVNEETKDHVYFVVLNADSVDGLNALVNRAGSIPCERLFMDAIKLGALSILMDIMDQKNLSPSPFILEYVKPRDPIMYSIMRSYHRFGSLAHLDGTQVDKKSTRYTRYTRYTCYTRPQ